MKIIVLIPTRGTIVAELVGALLNNTDGHELVLRMVHRLPVDAARNHLAKIAIATADDISLFPSESDPYVLWIDSDAFFIKGTLPLMLHTMEANPSIDLLAALFGPRAADRGATAFRDRSDKESYLRPGINFQRGDLIDVDHVGMHFVLHRVSLLRALGPDPFGDPSSGEADDAAVCGRIRHGQGRITVATGIPVFHVDQRNGAAYTPGVPACVVESDTISTEATATELPPERRTYGPRVDAAVRNENPRSSNANKPKRKRKRSN